jgi:hypothetical protein
VIEGYGIKRYTGRQCRKRAGCHYGDGQFFSDGKVPEIDHYRLA